LTVIRPHVGGTYYEAGSLNRFLWYPATFGSSGWAHYTPTIWTDGVDSLSASGTITWWWNQMKSRIASRLSIPSPVEIGIDMFYGAKHDTGTAVVTVVATDPIVYSNLRLTMCVIQNGLPPGGQVVRSWEDFWGGVTFSIAEGDTFTHSEEFVIKTAWPDENCRFVAFVQDANTYDVLQSAQSPVLVPTPAKVSGLSIDLVEDEIWLEWPAVTLDTGGNPLTVDGYHVYRDTVAFHDPGSDPFFFTTDTWFVDDSGVVGTLDRQYFYWVAAVAGSKESIASPGAGEFDRLAETGK
jgi:hypothetical protein